MKIILLAVLVFICTKGCSSAKIAMLPMFGRSHFIVMEKLAVELQCRGHEVVIYVGEGETSYTTGCPFVKLFKYTDKMKQLWENRALSKKHLSGKNLIMLQRLKVLFSFQTVYCDSLISDSDAFAKVKTADILIGDSLYPCSSLVSDWLDIPHAIVMLSGLQTPVAALYGIQPNPIAYVPQPLSGLSALEMGPLDRVKNIGCYLYNVFALGYYFYPAYQQIKDKYKINPTKTIEESIANVDLLLVAADFALARAQPTMPHVREVGYFMPSPAQPLPAELEEFMQGSGDEGVILVAFGTFITELDSDALDGMSVAFSKLSQNVLWKVYPGNHPRSVSPNVMTVEWLPQNDILGHNKTRLFITHAGANGMAETAYHGVPVVCSPFFGDQPDNAQTMKDAGMGEILNVNYATADQLVSVINKVLRDKSYTRNASRVSHAMKNRARAPVQEAADLVEYVHALGGHMDHLKPRSLYLPFYQVYMLDVMAVLALALVVIIVVIVGLVRLVVRAWSLKKTKTA